MKTKILCAAVGLISLSQRCHSIKTIALTGLFIVQGILILNVAATAIEYSRDAQVGDFVRIILQDSSSFEGDLVELTEKQAVLQTNDGRVVLLRSSISDILVIPRLDERVRLVMVDDSIYEGNWAGEDDNNVYVQGPQGKVALLKSQVARIDVVRSDGEGHVKQGKQQPWRLGLALTFPDVFAAYALRTDMVPVVGLGGLHATLHESGPICIPEGCVTMTIDASIWLILMFAGTANVQAILGWGEYTSHIQASAAYLASPVIEDIRRNVTFLGARIEVPITDTIAISLAYIRNLSEHDPFQAFWMYGLTLRF